MKNIWLLLMFLTVASCQLPSNAVCEEALVLAPRHLLPLPTGTDITLTCTRRVNNGLVKWLFRPPDSTGNRFNIEIPDTITEVFSHSSNTTKLLFPASMEFNGASFKCILLGSPPCSFGLDTAFYGPPSTPFHPKASIKELRSLSISWSSATAEGVPEEFTLTMTNLNQSDSSPITVTGIESCHRTVTRDISSCDVFSFQVMASNDAGTSMPSEVVTSNFPLLPVLSSVQYTMVGLTLNVTVEATACPDYPVTGYFLALYYLPGGMGNADHRIQLPEVGGRVGMEMVVQRSEWYSFRVEATNEVGTVRSPPHHTFESTSPRTK